MLHFALFRLRCYPMKKIIVFVWINSQFGGSVLTSFALTPHVIAGARIHAYVARALFYLLWIARRQN